MHLQIIYFQWNGNEWIRHGDCSSRGITHHVHTRPLGHWQFWWNAVLYCSTMFASFWQLFRLQRLGWAGDHPNLYSCNFYFFLPVAQNKDTVTGPNANNVCVELNPAYKISAALTYTAQLVHMLAYFLDVRLPYKMLIRWVSVWGK